MRLAPKLLIICLITLGVHLLSQFSGAVPFFDYRFFDLLSKNRKAPFDQSSNATVVVEIDETSLNQFGQWPWPRLLLAKGVEEILKQRPASVGLDIFFPEPDRTSPHQIIKFYQQRMDLDIWLNGLPSELFDHDQVFAHALKSGPTVLPLFASSKTNASHTSRFDTNTFLPLPEALNLPKIRKLLFNTESLQQSAQGFGYINAAVDNDGIFRRQPLVMEFQGQAAPSLAVAMLRQVDPTLKITIPEDNWSPADITFADKKILFNRHGEILNSLYPREVFKQVSMADVITGKVPESLFSGKLVLIGATAAGLYDQYMTARGAVIPGVYVHAALLENVMHGHNLYQPEVAKTGALILSFLCSLIIVWLVFQRHYLSSWLIYLGTTISTVALTWYQLQQGVYLSIGYFLTPFSFLFFFISLFFAILHYVERKRFLEDLGEAHSATIDSMTMVAESRDVETGAHIIRTKEYIRLLAQYLRENTQHKKYLSHHILDLLYRAAPLHDIGKVGIPDVILQKPGRLEAREMEVMRTHVEIGRSVIENAINSYNKTNEFLTIASNIAYSHHEKWDGTGYPIGLKGEEIPLEGRMMALADVYDALISRRCYKEPLPFEEAEKIILNDIGKHFDPTVIAAFIALKNEFREIAQRYEEGNEINALHLDQKYILEQSDPIN
jgi:HD-GYP domain-containing protein (c-di-GMP phosphodiesterase class II)